VPSVSNRPHRRRATEPVVQHIADELTEHRFFASLPADLTKRLADCANNVVVQQGERLITEGGVADTFYAIRSGRVAVGVRPPAGALAIVETLHSGDLLGWSWLVPPHRWRFDAVAIEPVRAIQLHAACVRTYLTEHPEAGYAVATGIASVMAERLESARLRLLDLYGSGRADER